MTANSVFVGRSAELARLSELLDQAREGRSGGVFLLGDAGVGKSRLLGEAKRMAAERGVRVASAACLPLTTPLPLDPVLQLLRSLGHPVRASVGDSPRDMFWIVLERLQQASVPGPLLLSLDDVQWSDGATIDLVHYCLARLTDLPLAWLLTARSARSQVRLVHRLEREGLLERLELGTLSGQETRELTESLLDGSNVSEDVIDILYTRTGGNPFLCVELLRALSSTGAAGRLSGAGAPGAVEALVPATVRDAIEDRADRLSPTARAALDWAAVLPEPFVFEELEAVAGAGSGNAPEELADAGFLLGGEDGRWRFLHSIIRDSVYRQLPQAERIRRHARVADALAAGPLARLAPQLERARRWRQAAKAYLKLGEAALNAGEGADAARLYEHAEQLAGVANDELLRRRAGAGRVLALLRAGAGQEARRTASALRSALRIESEPDERLRFLGSYAMALMLVHDTADIESARDALEEAAPLIEHAKGPALADALATRAWFSLRTGERTLALADAEIAADLARASDDARLEARVLNSLGLAVGMNRSAVEGVGILERAAELAFKASLPVEAGRAYVNLSFLDSFAGDTLSAQAHLHAGLAIEGLPASLTAVMHSNMGFFEAELGDLDAGLAHELAALRVAARGGPLTRVKVACDLTYVHLWRGELAAARRLLESYELLPGDIKCTPASELWGFLLEEEGAPAEALAPYRKGAVLFDPISVNCEAGVARTAAAIGDPAAARAALARMDRLVQRWPVGEWMREEARGWVATGEGRTDEAIQRFRAAADRSSRAYDSVRLRLEAARLAASREQVRAAIEEFEQMGAVHAADRARSIARGLGMRPGRRQRRGGLLSGREQEVARLVAAGKTNAEIAAALYLSPRTVERHVGNVLAKLGYRSRVQIVTEAAAGRLPGAANTTRVASQRLNLTEEAIGP